MNADAITARAIIGAIDDTKAKPSRADLLWLVQRAYAIRHHTKGWTRAEIERSWAEWDRLAQETRTG